VLRIACGNAAISPAKHQAARLHPGRTGANVGVFLAQMLSESLLLGAAGGVRIGPRLRVSPRAARLVAIVFWLAARSVAPIGDARGRHGLQAATGALWFRTSDGGFAIGE
jgi:hypothetical protein